jgi:hypothetical protein
MDRCKLCLIATTLLLLSACGPSGGGDPAPRQFTVTLTEIAAVKQGSDETVPIDGVPADGATLTLSWE